MIDWKMPQMDGLETAGKIREIAPRKVPILVLKSYEWSEIETQAVNAGMNGFLAKPFLLQISGNG